MTTVEEIERVCDAMKSLLIAKNNAYGDSVMNPVRIFSKASVEEQIAVRLDDKLSRVARGENYGGEDTVTDLAGYLLLMMVARGDGKLDQSDAEAAAEWHEPSPEWTLKYDRAGDLWGELDGQFYLYSKDENPEPVDVVSQDWETIERRWGPMEDAAPGVLTFIDKEGDTWELDNGEWWLIRPHGRQGESGEDRPFDPEYVQAQYGPLRRVNPQ